MGAAMIKLIVTRPRDGWLRAAYKSEDGRYTITPFDDASAGNGAHVPRGWLVVDATTGKQSRWIHTLNELRRALAPKEVAQ